MATEIVLISDRTHSYGVIQKPHPAILKELTCKMLVFPNHEDLMPIIRFVSTPFPLTLPHTRADLTPSLSQALNFSSPQALSLSWAAELVSCPTPQLGNFQQLQWRGAMESCWQSQGTADQTEDEEKLLLLPAPPGLGVTIYGESLASR